ncbi:Alcohol dehydrogenase GroES domain protein [Gluconacetobacter diazotrophicus PA1 5]|uniref:Alcohol dehydrogenase catalytic domain-containing protein n=2 Tax=Gluconacetobacter diazotrophicus TaxID=33996 RepID=A0A7W4I8U0_GLUDI|nr:alcohol dehydrogenase catalytic domain-containing protein [Gluconacetobacter diazotrophicus]ACI51977.1 Alcohol dehydrogenase GroES domain protein [Gluconacetobacter diazotrophicus PA1 5]MBB2158421.1 alcohol dehydrogenase catalytic domain-containing protein [Gluconacetobacter diazotrophicus]TWB05117.1 2-desacetyl-2-hydroxyethyl bacteriochlorophyllide A dehydrogenase [Gluconacetobacter diazotrophicus]
MDTMRAAVLVAPHRFEVRAVLLPPVGPDDVLVKVDRCGICGTDLHIFAGHYAADRLPLVPGHEFTGTIARMGERVTGLEPGQRVVADINVGCGHCFYCRRNEVLNCRAAWQVGIHRDGAFAEYVAIPARQIVPAPAGVAAEILALTEPVSCVVRAARKAGATFGQSVVILGAGPIGNLHVQMMRLAGAAPIIVVELSPERARLAAEAGADVVVTDPDRMQDIVRAHTGGRGADIVIESVGVPALYARAFDLIRPGGHVAAFGLTGPDATVPVGIVDMILKETSMAGSVAGMGQDVHDALTLLVHDRFRVAPFIGTVVPLADIQQTFDTIRDRPEVLKIQIAPT